MNRNLYYRSTDDLSMRHRDTYVGIKTGNDIEAHLVTGVGSRSRGNYYLEFENVSDKSLNDESLIIDRPVVGFTNIKKKDKFFALWAEASADRQIKKSLDLRMFRFNLVNSALTFSYGNHRKQIAQTAFDNVYPNFGDSLAIILNGDAFSIAFDKKFALSLDSSGSIVVYYKDRKVGWLEDSNIVLGSSFRYLIEQLEEIADVNVRVA